MDSIDGRLRPRPARPRGRPEFGPGTHTLTISPERRAVLFVPGGQAAQVPAALVVMLHGVGGEDGNAVSMTVAWAKRCGTVVLAPSSKASTWDVFHGGGYGPDVAFIGALLEWTMDRYIIDPERTAIGGFSDGASYALTLGLKNGDVFGHILAFSPGFALPSRPLGRPRIFISHGTQDPILPIDACGRAIARRLVQAGHDVDYREFDGGHVVPPGMIEAASNRVLGE